MRRYHIIACHIFWRELCHYAAQTDDILFTFNFLRQGLHNEPSVLRAETQAAVDAASNLPEYSKDIRGTAATSMSRPDAILLGYGLCSNGIVGIKASNVPLIVPRAHDCITLFLGAKEVYRRLFDSYPGTYWYTTGWNETGTMPGPDRFDLLKQKYVEKYGEDNAAFLIETEMSWIEKYKMAMYVDLGLGDSERHIDYTKRCADYCKWD